MAKGKRRGWCRKLLLGKPGTRWWRRGCRLLVASALLLALAIAGLHVFRKPWIEPVPGVSVEMTRRHVTLDDFGPDSAYRLFLTALAEIAKAEAADPDENVRGCYKEVLGELGIEVAKTKPPLPVGSGSPRASQELQPPAEPERIRAWSYGWRDALEKLTHHSWPTVPPPAAPPPSPTSPPMGMLGAGDEYDMSDPHYLAIRREAPWTLAQYEQILHGLALHQPAIPQLDLALGAPAPQVPTIDTLLDTGTRQQWVRDLCNWLAISAHTHAAKGDYAEARRDLQRSLATAALFTRGGSPGDHCAAWGCGNLISVAARAVAANHPVPRALLCEMATDFLHHAESAEPFVECVRADFVAQRSFVPIYYGFAAFDPIGYPYRSDGWRERLVSGLAFAVAPLAGSTPDKTVRNLESLFQHWVVLAQKPYSAAVQAEYDAIKEGWNPRRTTTGLVLGTRDPFGYHMASWGIDTPDRLHAWSATQVAVLRGTALFLTVRAYETDHGGLPDSLVKLVPTYLRQLPVDPFSGKPFRYLRSGVPGLSPDAWAVYSVGPNCADDGGTAHVPASFHPDLVIPSQNRPRE